jgi:hypothetical protein
MKGPETRLVKKIRVALAENFPGSYVRKIHGNKFQNIGVPDLLCCVRGIFFGLEVKIPAKRISGVTPAQRHEGNLIVKSGGYFAVVCSPEEAFSFVKKGLRHHARLSILP